MRAGQHGGSAACGQSLPGLRNMMAGQHEGGAAHGQRSIRAGGQHSMRSGQLAA